MSLSADETRRYARHLVLKDIGGAGQQALKSARVVVIGAGGLGSPVIAYLAAAGVGTIGVVDNDTVWRPSDCGDGATEPHALAKTLCQPFDVALTAALDRTPDRPSVVEQAVIVEERNEVLRRKVQHLVG